MPRNVVNTDEIEEFVAHLERRTAHEPVRDWLRSTYRKWLINHGPAAEEIVLTPGDVTWTAETMLAREVQTGRLFVYGGAAPAWLEPALHRGDQIVRVDCGQEAERDAWLVVDWLNDQRDRPVFGRLNRISYPQALAATRLWHRQLASRLTVEEWAGDAELEQQFGDGYRIVRLKTPRALDIEGARMGHCVATYDDDLRHGTVILSLRDPSNRPHCTMERIGQKIFQVKGKRNRPPVAKYRPYIRQFIALRRLEVVDDIDNVGTLLYADGRLCRDVNEYVKVMSTHVGWRLWERRPSYPLDNWVTLAPLRMVARLRDELDDDTQELLFRSLAHGFESGVRFKPAATLNVFGTEFRYVFADYPFALFYLRRAGVFRGSDYNRRINAVIDRAVGGLMREMARRPDWLFGVKMREYMWLEDNPSDYDLLTASRMEFRPIRHRRHTMLRQRMAEIRRHHRSSLRDAAVPPVVMDRWRREWLDVQTVLEARSHEFL